MRNYLERTTRWFTAGWFGSVVLLVLPACGFDPSGLGSAPTQNLIQGNQPWSSMIMCDIEKMGGRHCPGSQAEIDGGIRFSDAAIALTEGRTSSYGLDDSEQAKQRCNGDPEVVAFQGPFPQGIAVCLNCSQVPTIVAAVFACQNHCYDIHGTVEEGGVVPVVPPPDAVKSFCDAHTRVATNGLSASGELCYANLCTADGNTTGADDPRVKPEPVVWTILTGAAPAGPEWNGLERTAPETPAGYDAGAVSEQWITHGNAYVEFSVESNTQSHFLGLTSVNGCAPNCGADDPGYTSIGFALLLDSDGRYYITESGLGQAGPDFNTSWGQYSAGQRFRITLIVDETDPTKARVIYSKVVACNFGEVCNLDTIYEHTGPNPSYPFRVDTSLKHLGSKLTDVRLVRIQFQQ
jgi:hypothetical protein